MVKQVHNGDSQLSGLTDAQKVTATSSLQRSISAMRDFLLDGDINDRQLHTISFLGSRELMVKNGTKLEEVNVTRLKTKIMNEFSVTDTSADATLKDLREKGLIEYRPVPDHGSKKTVHLTELGVALYDQMACFSVDLVLSASDFIKRDGPIPTNYLERTKSFFKDFAIVFRRSHILAAALACTLSIAGPNEGRSDVKRFYDDGLTPPSHLGQIDLTKVPNLVYVEKFNNSSLTETAQDWALEGEDEMKIVAYLASAMLSAGLLISPAYAGGDGGGGAGGGGCTCSCTGGGGGGGGGTKKSVMSCASMTMSMDSEPFDPSQPFPAPYVMAKELEPAPPFNPTPPISLNYAMNMGVESAYHPRSW